MSGGLEQKAKTYGDLQIAYAEIFNKEPLLDSDKLGRIASLQLFERMRLVTLSDAEIVVKEAVVEALKNQKQELLDIFRQEYPSNWSICVIAQTKLSKIAEFLEGNK